MSYDYFISLNFHFLHYVLVH